MFRTHNFWYVHASLCIDHLMWLSCTGDLASANPGHLRTVSFVAAASQQSAGEGRSCTGFKPGRESAGTGIGPVTRSKRVHVEDEDAQTGSKPVSQSKRPRLEGGAPMEEDAPSKSSIGNHLTGH